MTAEAAKFLRSEMFSFANSWRSWMDPE